MRKTFLTIQDAGTVAIIFLVGAIMIGYGVLAVLKPELVWKWQHMGKRWMYQNAEPTCSALAWMRICGGFSIIVSIFCVLFMLWKFAG